jgi:hypothetical protein
VLPVPGRGVEDLVERVAVTVGGVGAGEEQAEAAIRLAITVPREPTKRSVLALLPIGSFRPDTGPRSVKCTPS